MVGEGILDMVNSGWSHFLWSDGTYTTGDERIKFLIIRELSGLLIISMCLINYEIDILEALITPIS